jgi:hypothetical protein
MRKVKLNDIRIDGGTQGRVVIDQQRVYHFVEMMKEGYEFDPIDTNFDGATYWLVDGFHRYHALQVDGHQGDNDQVRAGGTLEEAVIRSLRRQRTPWPTSFIQTRKIVADALANPLLKDKSNYEIAKICVVSQSFVAGVKDPEKRKSKKRPKNATCKRRPRRLQVKRLPVRLVMKK